jgi:4-carboxymuconolactone decarboxylase
MAGRRFLTTGFVMLGMASQVSAQPARPSVAPADMKAIAPALARYTDDVLFGDNWENPRLTKRDRSLVTISALIAGGKVEQLRGHLARALDNGVKPSEVSGTLTHLAFYSGWPNAVSAVGVARKLFAERGIADDQIPAATMAPIPIEAATDRARAASVDATVAPTAPNLARFTNDVLFADLWRRPDLTPRDRSLVTVAALTMAGDDAQLPFHIRRALDNGVTVDQLSEVMTHLAFYAGWPKAMTGAELVRTAVQKPEATDARASTVVARRGGGPLREGPVTNFTGKVQVSAPFMAATPSRLGGATVTFQPGARTNWHSHPLGQTLIVTEGVGWTQMEGGPVVEMRPGDVVIAPPGVRHWHGASLSSAMSHVAVAEAVDGKVVDWFEPVPDQVYRQGVMVREGG